MTAGLAETLRPEASAGSGLRAKRTGERAAKADPDPRTLVVEALRRVIAEASGLPLFGARSRPGLFANSIQGKQAAEFAREQGYLRVVSERTGKAERDACIITEKGLAYVLAQANPR